MTAKNSNKINYVTIISITVFLGIVIIGIVLGFINKSTSQQGSQTTKATGSAPATTLGFSPDNLIIDSISLYGKTSIIINPGSNTLTAGTISFSYDPSYLNIVSVTPSYSTVFQSAEPAMIDNVKGTATITYTANIPQAISTPTTIGSILFKIVKPITIQNRVVYNSSTFITAKDVSYNALIGSTPLSIASVPNAPAPTSGMLTPTPKPLIPSPTPKTTPLVPSPTPSITVTARPDSTLEFAPNSVITKLGSSFTETVVVKTNSNQLTSLKAVVTFNPNIFEVTSATPAVQNLNIALPMIDNTAGRVSYSASPSKTLPFTGTANVMNITFRVKNATQSETLRFSGDSYAYGIGGGTMNLLVGSTIAIVTTGPTAPTPTVLSCKSGVTQFTVDTSCGANMFRHMTGQCYNGNQVQEGTIYSCDTVSNWFNKASILCQNSCK